MRPEILFCGCLILAGCAKDPYKIEPAYVPATTYASLDCRGLHDELDRVRALKDDLYAAQTKQRGDDAAFIILFGVSPTMVGTGAGAEQRIATVKGAEIGVGEEMARKGCPASRAGLAAGS